MAAAVALVIHLRRYLDLPICAWDVCVCVCVLGASWEVRQNMLVWKAICLESNQESEVGD